MPESDEIEGPKTLGMHIASAWRRLRATRPVSFYLILALFVMLPLSTQIIRVWHDPRRLALYVSLALIFLFVILIRAVFDLVEILSKHLKERESLFRKTLGEQEFVEKLGRKVSDRRDRP